MKTGNVYALTASDEPLQIRYIGQTTLPLERRLQQHFWEITNLRKAKWFEEVRKRGVEIRIHSLGCYPWEQLLAAERKWIKFWAQYCDLLNVRETDAPLDDLQERAEWAALRMAQRQWPEWDEAREAQFRVDLAELAVRLSERESGGAAGSEISLPTV